MDFILFFLWVQAICNVCLISTQVGDGIFHLLMVNAFPTGDCSTSFFITQVDCFERFPLPLGDSPTLQMAIYNPPGQPGIAPPGEADDKCIKCSCLCISFAWFSLMFVRPSLLEMLFFLVASVFYLGVKTEIA